MKVIPLQAGRRMKQVLSETRRVLEECQIWIVKKAAATKSIYLQILFIFRYQQILFNVITK